VKMDTDAFSDTFLCSRLPCGTPVCLLCTGHGSSLINRSGNIIINNNNR